MNLPQQSIRPYLLYNVILVSSFFAFISTTTYIYTVWRYHMWRILLFILFFCSWNIRHISHLTPHLKPKSFSLKYIAYTYYFLYKPLKSSRYRSAAASCQTPWCTTTITHVSVTVLLFTVWEGLFAWSQDQPNISFKSVSKLRGKISKYGCSPLYDVYR